MLSWLYFKYLFWLPRQFVEWIWTIAQMGMENGGGKNGGKWSGRPTELPGRAVYVVCADRSRRRPASSTSPRASSPDCRTTSPPLSAPSTGRPVKAQRGGMAGGNVLKENRRRRWRADPYGGRYSTDQKHQQGTDWPVSMSHQDKWKASNGPCAPGSRCWTDCQVPPVRVPIGHGIWCVWMLQRGALICSPVG